MLLVSFGGLAWASRKKQVQFAGQMFLFWNTVTLYWLYLRKAEIQSQCEPDHLQMWSDHNAVCVDLHYFIQVAY